MAEWLKPAETMTLDGPEALATNGASRREGILRVRAVDDASSRATVESVLQAFAKRWGFESDEASFDGAPTLTYQVRLKNRVDSEGLLTALHQQLGPADPRHDSTPEAEATPRG